MMIPTRIKFPVFLLLGATLLLTSIPPPTFGQNTTKIDPELQKRIDNAPVGSTWDILVLFKEDPTLLPSQPYTDPNIEESHDSAYNTMLKLQKYADESQASVVSEIKSFYAARSSSGMKNVELEQFWCSLGVRVAPASKDLIDLLGDDRKPEHENITGILENQKLVLNTVVQDENVVGVKRDADDDEDLGILKKAYGVRKINAPAWWAKGYNGSGVIIGHIDSGVDIYHPSLKQNWVGQVDGWYSRANPNRKFPYESSPKTSHGTHTIGIAVGRGGNGTKGADNDTPTFFGVGVAPGARWTSCMPCNMNNGEVCTARDEIKCLEFFHCPNPKNKCRYRPNVITISMGCDQTATVKCAAFRFIITLLYGPCFRNLRSHGVIIVYAAGNIGEQGCQTINSPSDYEEVIAVGASNRFDQVTEYSSMGPPGHAYYDYEIENRGIFKPNLIAPGDEIISTIYTGKEGKFKFDYRRGTSMAAPHVAGAIALLLSRSANLTFANITKILRESAVKLPNLGYKNPGVPCGGKNNSVQPNHKIGHGRLHLPNLDSPILDAFPVVAPTRGMPPPPDFEGLDKDATPPSVRPWMVGVVIMAAMINLWDAALEM